jgi:predicted Holliday junction resolvase-like endonuclease
MVRSGVPAEVEQMIRQFSTDQKFIGTCTECETRAPLSKWNLFYMDQYRPEFQEFVDDITGSPAELKKEYQELKDKVTKLAAKKSMEINVGKTIEEVVSVLPTFPYHRNDCRSLLDPIDYLIFEGLAKEGKVSQMHFVDVKTGSARLNDHQKQIKDAVERKKVEFRLY